jgi:flavin reductase
VSIEWSIYREILEDPHDAAAPPRGSEQSFLLESFRGAMRQLAAGACAVTACDGVRRYGLTATSVISLSMEPPALLVSIRAGSRVLEALRKSRHFTVHLLAAGQQRLANALAGRLGDDDRSRILSQDAPWTPDRIPGALCHIDCAVSKTVVAYTHALVVGRVERVDAGTGTASLVYHDGRFHAVTPLADVEENMS